MINQLPERPRIAYEQSPDDWAFGINIAETLGLKAAVVLAKIDQLLISSSETKIFNNNAWYPTSVPVFHQQYFEGFFKTSTTYRVMNKLKDELKLIQIEYFQGSQWIAINWANWLALNPPITAEHQTLLAQFDYQRMPTIELGQRYKGFIYVLEEVNHRWYKIGKTKNLASRVSSLTIQLPFPVTMLHSIATDNMVFAEAYLHKHFAAKRLNGEWFQLDQDDVNWLRAIERLDDEVKQ